MGLAWSFFNPVLMLAIYTFVFSVVFKARWGVGGEESKTECAILLLVGLIVHGQFAECIKLSLSLFLSNVNYFKKLVFPLEILPFLTCLSIKSNCARITAAYFLEGLTRQNRRSYRQIRAIRESTAISIAPLRGSCESFENN
jgi:homopolymeric O-antigen transport system permease protein